ncbi:MAG: deoxyribodipyrimidine photo-lyase [Bdellovibrionales bacterium]|nr:deoxyribodipyrimidine photo-lyase [Bdellovibrionales bacterium]
MSRSAHSLVPNYGIHWFRRDLRVAGNEALKWNWKQNDGRVVGLFCFDKDFLGRSDFSINRFQLFIHTLLELQKELRELGSDLLVLDIGPFSAFPDLLKKLNAKPNLITWCRDYEPFARSRDQKAFELFVEYGIECKDFRDHLLIEPEELSKDDGTGYQVYSPFSRKWLEVFQTKEVQSRLKNIKNANNFLEERLRGKISKNLFKLNWEDVLKSHNLYPDILKQYDVENSKKVTVEIPPAGSLNAFLKLKEFKNSLKDYGSHRDFPASQATSGLSLYLKNGSITIPQVIELLKLKPYKKKQSSQDIFFSELIWREFYYHILYRHPYVEAGCFLKHFDKIKWPNNKKYFEAWKMGTTGFPIVDAGMRELNSTGWMHNRVRMIVASFLTKDLLIDWRWGEKYFMEKLLDGDLAPNNGGWQWAASTGCDPQPYFRIFNPWLQSKKFDLKGEYIYKFIPELKNVDANKLHEPILKHKIYPEPIVDHGTQRLTAIHMYEQAKNYA